MTVPAEEHLRISVSRAEDRVVIHLAGELDLASAPSLAGELKASSADGTAAIVLDMRELSFIDSSGLRAVLAAREQAADAGYEFAVVRGSPQVRRLFAITRADEHLQMLDSPDEGLAKEPLSGSAR